MADSLVDDLRRQLAKAEAELAVLTARAAAPSATVAESPQRPLAGWQRELLRIEAKSAWLRDLHEASKAESEGDRMWKQIARVSGRV
jgi:hypothetical protein